MKNRVYFFTGTGNSLKVAKDIAASLAECEIVAIHEGMDMDIPTGYERIGFVFPVYFFGLPEMVAGFVHEARVSPDSAEYFFAVATPGGFSGKPLAQLEGLLSPKGVHLSYGAKIRMNANYIVRYGSIGLYYTTAMRAYGRHMRAILGDIARMKPNEIEKHSERIEKTYRNAIRGVHETDAGYQTSDQCTACGICVSVCPAGNIALCNGRPTFDHRCESCMACIQYCPQKALNYGDRTQGRRRYTHPDITHAEISGYYGNAQRRANGGYE